MRGTKSNGFQVRDGDRSNSRLESFQLALAGASMPCNSLPGLKRTALPGGILTSSPVRGLRPMPVLRGLTLKTPKRRSSMRCPRPRAFFSDSNTVSTACSAFVRLMFVVADDGVHDVQLDHTTLPLSPLVDARG